MKSNKKLICAVALASMVTAANAAIVWTGATSTDPFDDSNWDFSASSVTAVEHNVSIDDDVVITGGTIEIPNLPAQVRLQIGDGYTMTVDNSTVGLVDGGNDGVGGAPGGTGVDVKVVNGSAFNPFFIVNAVALDIDATSSATFGGGGNPINISTVNLTLGSTLAFLAETPEQFTTEHLGKITVDGQPAVIGENIQLDPFNGSSGSMITVVPEPTTGVLMVVGLAAIGLLRRQCRA